MSTPDTAKMINRVALLMAQADHPNTGPAESETFRAKAQELMLKYRIAEEELRITQLASGVAATPITSEMFIASFESKYRNEYYSMFYWIADHLDVRFSQSWGKLVDEETGEYQYVLNATVVGFDTDIRLLEVIYTGVALHFGSVLEPKINPALSDQENCYALRGAGVERHRVADLLWGAGSSKISSRNAKVSTLYTAECEARGEDPRVVGRSVNAKTYRETFARYYVDEIRTRLWKMKSTAGTDSGALVLHGRTAAVDEAFYNLYPERRPSTEVENSEPCPKCARAKSGHCRDHPAGSYGGGPAYSSAGAAAGRRAGATANLDGASPTPRGRLGT